MTSSRTSSVVFALGFVRTIRDPIHGLIPITKLEQQILAIPLVQRLRRIRQLGVVNLVYPGANHSRFEHSVGVMQLTSILLDDLYRRGQIDNVDYANMQAIRLAGLLHDVGHGPFSHTFEELARFGYGFSHEEITEDVLLSSPDLLRLVGKRMVVAIVKFLKGGMIGGIPGEIIKGDIGTDRMDYLIRDTYYTGLGHRPDISGLVSCIRLLGDKKKRVAVAPEDISTVELLATVRYHHYGMIAHRKECRAHEFLLLRAIVDHLASVPAAKRNALVRRAFSEFDDIDLISALRSRQNPYMREIDDGEELPIVYRMKLQEIRSALAKYCLFRLRYSDEGLGHYCNAVADSLRENIRGLNHADIIVDLNLWNPDVCNVISHRRAYVTEHEEFSALLCDESVVLRAVAAGQALSSAIIVYANTTSKSRSRRIAREVYRRRDLMLSDSVLIPMTISLVKRSGLTKFDDVFVLLHSLNDFYLTLVEEGKMPELNDRPYLRGMTRLTDIASACHDRIGKPKIDIEEFRPRSRDKLFKYSPELFSIINTMNTFGMIDLEYPPEYRPEKKRYTRTYFLRIREKKMRRTIFEPTKEFRSLRRSYLSVFEQKELAPAFEKFYADTKMKVLGGPSSRAHPK